MGNLKENFGFYSKLNTFETLVPVDQEITVKVAIKHRLIFIIVNCNFKFIRFKDTLLTFFSAIQMDVDHILRQRILAALQKKQDNRASIVVITEEKKEQLDRNDAWAEELKSRGRKRKKPIVTRKTKKDKLNKIKELEQCCKKRQCCKEYSTEELKACREMVHSLDKAIDRRAIVLQQFNGGNWEPTIAGNRVCLKFFAHAFGLSNTFIARLKTIGIHSEPADRTSPKLVGLLVWFDELGKLLGEALPNQDLIQLPFRTRLQVYSLYESDSKSSLNAPITLSSFTYFKSIWLRFRPKIVLRKWLAFGKCDRCTRMREKKSKTQDPNVHSYTYTYA